MEREIRWGEGGKVYLQFVLARKGNAREFCFSVCCVMGSPGNHEDGLNIGFLEMDFT